MTRLIPPVWFLLGLLTMWALDRVAPVVEWTAGPVQWLGGAFLAGGVTLASVAARLFRRRGTAVRPFEHVTVLVVEGPYRITRNPMYLGILLVSSGIALLLESLTPLLVIPVLWWVLDRGFIEKEEALLTDRFGQQYLDYKARVRRWI